MVIGVAEWTMAVTTLLALIMVRSLRTQIRTNSTESYDKIANGLIFLALASLARIYQSLGLFEGVPFLSETVFFDLAYWIVVIPGTALIVGGVANWLPLARLHRQYNKTKIERLDLLRKIEQLIGVETRLDAILSNGLQYMTQQMSLSAAVAYKRSASTSRLTLAAATGDLADEADHLSRATVKLASRWSNRANPSGSLGRHAVELPSELEPPNLTLPLTVAKREVGFLLFWYDEDSNLDSDDLLTLRLAVDLLGRKIDNDRLLLRQRYAASRDEWFNRLEKSVHGGGDTRARFSKLVTFLRERCAFGFASISVVAGKTDTMTRYSCGPESGLLVEHNLVRPQRHQATGPAFEDDREVCLQGLDSDTQPERNEVLAAAPIGSLVAIPFSIDERSRGVLTLAATDRYSFGLRFREDLAGLKTVLAAVAWPVVLQAAIAGETRYLEQARMLSETVAVAESESVRLEAVARLISDETDADLVRISQVDESGSFLESKALISTVPMSGMVPANGQMILSLMPLHEQVLRTGEQLQLEGPNLGADLSEIEARQSFMGQVASVLLLPVKSVGKCRAVVSIASLNPGRPLRMNRQTNLLLDTAAAVLGVSLGSQAFPPIDGNIRRARTIDRAGGRLAAIADKESPVPF
jgi:hypothetical protein